MMIMCLTSKEVALTTPSQIANNSASRAVAHLAGIELEFASVPIGAVTGMKRDLIRKVVQQPTSWAYFRVG